MALIGQIRRRGSWILIVLIGLGLGGFIIQDMLISGPTGGMGGSQPDLGKVNGEEISIQDFNRVENLVLGSGGDVYAQRNSLWDFFVEDKILKQYGNGMGLNVSVEELKALQFGPDYSPVIIQNFPNPQVPGLPNTEQLNQLRTMLETGGVDAAIANGQLSRDFRAIWGHQENLIIKDRLQTKLNAVIAKGMYTPSWMAEDISGQQSQTISFNYVKVPFDELDSDQVSLSDADYKNYIQENSHLFERAEEGRKLSYVTFEVAATAQDSADIRDRVSTLAADFEKAENDTMFIETKQGRFTGAFVKESQLPIGIRETIATMEAGDVYGPYFEPGFYKAVKVMDTKVLPDSVRARHILKQINPADPTSFNTAQAQIDSIKNAIEAGTTTFQAMNDKYNDDTVAKLDGGDLGYAGLNGMVKPFNDLIFYDAEPNKLYTVTTQFGIHLVEVLGRQFNTNETAYLLGFLEEDIIPSETTQKEQYNEAFAFMTNNRTLEDMKVAANENPALTVQSTSAFDRNAFQVDFALPSGQAAREMVKWAFKNDTKIGKVASYVYEFSDPIKYFDNKYVVIALEDIQKPGLPAVNDIKAEIQPAVANAKKGELLSTQLQGKSLSDIASTYSTTVDTLNDVSFSSSFLQNAGNEPKVVGEAFKLSDGQTSAPIVGNTGVYVLQVISKSAPAAATANVPLLRQQYNTTARSRVNTQLMAAIKENAKVKDNRAAYY
ncbi:MAG: peptidyl-prolyl cis-trans isomerase [Saprospiraceae bacterium]